ncbi:MAG TPA: DUF4202 domain-containing protein [Chryseosolibacter sp.]|nr:DUF4202 domain-containing protein [Chryseosolibacter sp.]
MHSPSEKFRCAIAAFAAYHRRDPNIVVVNDVSYPSELLYTQRVADRLNKFHPEANEVVQLAAHCQHIGRWEIPREKYSMDKKGYLQWRNAEKLHHSRIAETILSECGYDGDTIERVQTLLMKKELHSNADTQLLEDVVCLVFLEHYLEEFSTKHPDEKVVDILRKTMRKMSVEGKRGVDSLQLSSKNRSLIERAESLS